jgi:hypothetical protein
MTMEGLGTLYYYLLVPSMLPVLLCFVVLNWVALKYWRSNT